LGVGFKTLGGGGYLNIYIHGVNTTPHGQLHRTLTQVRRYTAVYGADEWPCGGRQAATDSEADIIANARKRGKEYMRLSIATKLRRKRIVILLMQATDGSPPSRLRLSRVG